MLIPKPMQLNIFLVVLIGFDGKPIAHTEPVISFGIARTIV